jgi:DUF3071 family protein
VIKLRVVGSSRDHGELVLSNKPKGAKGSHSVAIDKKLLDVLQKAVYARREARGQFVERKRTPPPEPKIPLVEIQRHLRSGLTPSQVADEAGVPIDYVERFYTPVLYERAGVIQDAQLLFQEKPRLGSSALPLGEAVDQNLSARRVRLADEAATNAWNATRQEGQSWVVTLTFPFRGRARTARWRFDQRARVIEPANKLAADIGWVSDARRDGSANGSEPAEGAPPRARRKTARRKSTAKRKASARKPARKASRKASTRKAARKTPKKATRRKPTTRRKPAARRKTATRRKPAARSRKTTRRAAKARRRR